MTEGQNKEYILSAQLNKLFLNNFHKENNAKFFHFANYSMPINYELGVLKEHIHVRKSVGVFDVSHMGQILISKNFKNISQLEKFIPIDLKSMKLGQSLYSFILNKNGGVIDDIIISKIKIRNEVKFFIVYNADRKNIDEKIFKTYLTSFVILKNNCLISLQGPFSKNVLEKINISTDDILFMQIKTFDYNDKILIISRTGYTGEDGFEISLPNSISKEFIKKIMLCSDTILCGIGCRDTLRMEAGLSLYGNELNENLTPVDSGLTWAIDKKRLKNGNFNGAKKIINQLNKGTNQKKIGIQIKSKSILRPSMDICNNGTKVGFISSGGFSPSLNHSIGIGYLDKKAINNTENLHCLIRGNLDKIEVIKLPFVKHNYWRG